MPKGASRNPLHGNISRVVTVLQNGPEMGPNMAVVQGANIVLTAGEASLEMTVGPSGWTTVALRDAGTRKTLGAEMFRDLCHRLLKFLADPPSQLRWVLTFSETHYSAYGIRVDGQALLRIQDRDALFFAELTLSESDRQAWTETLELALGDDSAGA
jgi:hypothetical protein